MGSKLTNKIAELRARYLRPRYMRIVAEILVHDRREEIDGVTCPCCGSADAEIVERRPAADLVIDLYTGRRLDAESVPARDWAKYLGLAERYYVPIRCSVTTLPLLLDDTGRHIFASGGNRAAKTTTGLYWMALQILRGGGRGRRFWLVATTDKKAFELLEKLFRVTPAPSGGEVAPILPAALVARSPETHGSRNLITRLVDGSIVDLRSFHGDPDAARAKSDPIVAGLVDEAAHLPSESWVSALRGRCVDFGGRLWFASTATPSSVLKALIVDRLVEWKLLPEDDEKRLSGKHEGAAWIFAPLPMVSNPWVPLQYIEHAMRTLDMKKAENRRDFLGEWVASEGLYWEDKFFPEQHTFAHDDRDAAAWSPIFMASVGAAGHVPVTAMARGRVTGSPSRNPHHATIRATNDRWLVGQDVNFRMESIVLQVTAPADGKKDPDTWHYWVQDCVTSVRSNSDLHAARLVSVELSRVFDPRGSTRALEGALVVIDPTAITDVDPHQRKHGQSGSIVDTYARHNLEVRAPLYRLSGGKWKKVRVERAATFAVLKRLLSEGRLHVATRCGPLLEAFATQLAEPEGHCPLDARRGKWDERMGPVDALRYLIYAVANAKPEAAARDWASLPEA